MYHGGNDRVVWKAMISMITLWATFYSVVVLDVGLVWYASIDTAVSDLLALFDINYVCNKYEVTSLLN